MKKTVLALMMAGAMVFGTASVAMAEDYMTLDYTMIDEEAYDGTWVTAFGVFDLFLPSDWNILVNVEEGEEPEEGVYFQAVNDDETYSVAISYAQTEDMDLDGLAAYLEEQGFAEVAPAVINDIAVVTYSIEADDVTVGGIATIGDQGGMYNVTIGAPTGDDSFTPIASNILCSFSATEYEEETEA